MIIAMGHIYLVNVACDFYQHHPFPLRSKPSIMTEPHQDVSFIAPIMLRLLPTLWTYLNFGDIDRKLLKFGQVFHENCKNNTWQVLEIWNLVCRYIAICIFTHVDCETSLTVLVIFKIWWGFKISKYTIAEMGFYNQWGGRWNMNVIAECHNLFLHLLGHYIEHGDVLLYAIAPNFVDHRCHHVYSIRIIYLGWDCPLKWM